MKTFLVLVSWLLAASLFAQKGHEPLALHRAHTFFEQAQFDSAHTHAVRYLTSHSSLSDSAYAEAAMLAGLSLSELHQHDSIGYLSLARTRALKSGHITLWLKAELSLAKDHFAKSFYAEALPHALTVDSVSKKHGIQNQTTVHALMLRSEISRLTFTPQAVNTAHDLMRQALAMATQIGDTELVHVVYMYLADLSGLREKYDEAKRFADLAFAYFIKQDDAKRVSRIYWIYTSYYAQLKDLQTCERMHRDRIAYLRQKKLSGEVASALVAYGNFLRTYRQDFRGALTHFEEAKAIYETTNETNSDRFLRLLVGMALSYAQVGDFPRAYRFYDEAYGLKVEIVRNAHQELTRNLETKYQTKEKEQAIALLTAKNQLAEQEKVYQRYLFVGLLLLLLGGGALAYYGYRTKLQTALKIKELDALKSRFFANISHEFRTPLTLIQSPLQSLLETEPSEDRAKKLQWVNQHATRMTQLVDQLLELSRLDAGHWKPIVKNDNLQIFLETLVAPFEFEAHRQERVFEKHIQVTPAHHWFDRDIFEKIVGNLLSNAVKYTPEKERIWIEASVMNSELHIRVENSGVALTPTETQKIFERFYQKDDSHQGAGIGLALVKELVELYQGTIEVTSAQDALAFSVVLPLDIQRLKSLAIISEPNEEPTEAHAVEAGLGELPLMLVVDDNAALRELVVGLFSDSHRVATAARAKEALRIAKKEVPDVIISDVMMPEMDGFEFANTLKNDEVTSFIPIILLTAKTGDEAHLQSLQSRADVFLTKPFNNRVLRAHVENLMAERARLRERFSKELVLKPMEVVLTSADEKFIKKLQTVIDQDLKNPDFSAEAFAATVGMSRMQLHRKLKSLMGLSASEFIRKERLKRSADLLKRENLNVSEVAYAVGFNDADYFTKCFKEEFGMTPSQYGLA